MLISLIAWIYISIVCLLWGHLSLSITGAISRSVTGAIAGSIIIPDTRPSPRTRLNPNLNPSSSSGLPLLCLAGLAVISTLALGLSLFMPLGWPAHLAVLLPPLLYCTKASNRRAIGQQITDTARRLSPASLFLLLASIGMVLIISVSPIVHPDTMYYHARSVLLFDLYSPIHGIANLRNELGFQSGWFAALSLFKSGGPSFYNIIFLNGAVLCWYFLFLAEKISDRGINGWPWLLLAAYTFLSWTQIRLTAASPSPDFIVSLYSWAAMYVFLLKEEDPLTPSSRLCLIVLFCVAAVLTKLSPIALLPLAIIALTRSFRLRPAKLLFGYACLAGSILLIRNALTSGYLLYPLSGTDPFPLPWKMTAASVTHFRQYISLYARFPVLHPLPAPFPQWVSRWWSYVDTIDRLLLIAILAGLLINAILTVLTSRKKKSAPLVHPDHLVRQDRLNQQNHLVSPNRSIRPDTIVFWICLAGSLLWFLNAPSPRFGTVFLVPLVFLLYRRLPLSPRTARMLPFLRKRSSPTPLPPVFLLATTCVILAITGYTFYRVVKFPVGSRLLVPAGIISEAYLPLGCDNDTISVDLLNNRMEIKGKGPLPCPDPTSGFSPIGTTIAEGFKPRAVNSTGN